MSISATAILTDDFVSQLRGRGYSGSVEALDALIMHEDFKGFNQAQIQNALITAAQGQKDLLNAEFVQKYGENVTPLKPLQFNEIDPAGFKHAITPNAAAIAREAEEAKKGSDVIRSRIAAQDAAGRVKKAPKAGSWLESIDDISLNRGIGLLVAGMSVFGAFSTAQHVLSKDEQGHTKVNLTPLAWTLGQGALAAGTAYLALRNPQFVTVAR